MAVAITKSLSHSVAMFGVGTGREGGGGADGGCPP